MDSADNTQEGLYELAVAIRKQSDLYTDHFEIARELFTAREVSLGRLNGFEIESRITGWINSLIEKIDHGPMGVSHDIVTRLLPNFARAVEGGVPQLIFFQLDRLLGEMPDAVEATMVGKPHGNSAKVSISYSKPFNGGTVAMKYFVEVERRAGSPWTDKNGVHYAIVAEDDYDDSSSWVFDC